MKHIITALLLVFMPLCIFATDVFQIDSSTESVLIGKYIYSLEDSSNKMQIQDIMQHNFSVLNSKAIVNFQVSNATFWLKFTVRNTNSSKKYYLEVQQPALETVNLYYTDSSGMKEFKDGMEHPFTQRMNKGGSDFVFNLDLKPGEERTYYLQVKGKEQVLAPIRIIDQASFSQNVSTLNVLFGIYCGIIGIMFFYNLFIYFTIRERSYIYYTLHTIFVGITQASLTGYAFKYLWPNSPWFADYSIFLFTSLVSIVGIQFLIEFLHVKKNLPRIHIVLKVMQLIYVGFVISPLLGFYSQTYGLILQTQSVIAIFILAIAVHLYRKGFAEAKYYLIGWSLLMVGIIIYVMKDFGVIPYNNFTSYSLVFGSAAEVALLSFALADKINIYRREKEVSQAQAFAAVQENERIVREQNVILEKKVEERTEELQITNAELNKAMKELKDAETQLVESEKMASLGQLTAGVAHEINNPINFVTSNVKPLNRDMRMLVEVIGELEKIALENKTAEEKQKMIAAYKTDIDYDYLIEEIDQLLSGIGEGASRTAEIVKGLRIFSRLDEDDLKKADINEGLDSTLVIINNQLSNVIKIEKNFGNLPLIDCYPGKLNQVFLNIISNAIHAVKKKFKDTDGGLLSIATYYDEEFAYIAIKDNGTGMDENTRKRMFEPFFTTKDVGEGTGLGMSIAYNTINKHNGEILVKSELGIGTEFILKLPLVQK